MFELNVLVIAFVQAGERTFENSLKNNNIAKTHLCANDRNISLSLSLLRKNIHGSNKPLKHSQMH